MNDENHEANQGPQTMEEYRRARAELKARWPAIAALTGDAYRLALARYTAEKAELDEALTRLARNVGRVDSPAGREAARAIPGLARVVTQAFWSGELELHAAGAPHAGWDGMPEVRAATLVLQAGGDGAALRRVLTLTAAMDRAREADALWLAAGRLYSACPWVFDPAEIARRADDVVTKLREYKVSQRHGADAEAWLSIARSIALPGPVRTVIEDGHGDALELLAAIRRGRAYPMLRGPKIGPLWVRMLAEPGGAKIERLSEVPVAVDVQVKRISEYLGVSDTVGLEPGSVKGLIQRAWMDDVREKGCDGPGALRDTCAALDPALWFWAKWGCMVCENSRRKRPIGPACEYCRFPQRG